MTGKIEGIRDRGRQRITFLISIAKGTSKPYVELIRKMQNTDSDGRSWSPTSSKDMAPKQRSKVKSLLYF